jgi:hypothetical protein
MWKISEFSFSLKYKKGFMNWWYWNYIVTFNSNKIDENNSEVSQSKWFLLENVIHFDQFVA